MRSGKIAKSARKEDPSMNNTRFGILVGLGLVLVVVGLSAFTVNERELAIKLQLWSGSGRSTSLVCIANSR